MLFMEGKKFWKAETSRNVVHEFITSRSVKLMHTQISPGYNLQFLERESVGELSLTCQISWLLARYSLLKYVPWSKERKLLWQNFKFERESDNRIFNEGVRRAQLDTESTNTSNTVKLASFFFFLNSWSYLSIRLTTHDLSNVEKGWSNLLLMLERNSSFIEIVK